MKLPPEVDKLLQAYFAGDTSPETIQAMEAWLREDPANPRILAEYGLVDRLIFCEQKTLDTAAIFAALLEAEEAAGPIVVRLPKKTKPTRAKHPQEPLKYKEAFLGLQSTVFDALRQKAGVITAIAAVLALAVVLIVSLSSNSNQPLADSTAAESNEPIEPGPVGPALNKTVATLTNTHNAQWAERVSARGSLTPGSKLHPNQTLTLTAGFAEITTHDGAIAILEAPATIELLDNNNALQLHSGKLVGICETDSSKGFVVRTQHMGVTDLGTRFGVEVTHEGTRAHVFEGDIAVHAPDALDFDQATRLGVGESAITEAGKSIVITTTRPGLTFVRDWAAATNAPRVTGPIRYTASVPTALDFDQREADDHILLLSEQKGLRLSTDIPVSKAELLDGHRFRADSKVPVGTVVDTYLLHGDIVGDDPGKGISFRGSIRFDRPILGVIANGIDLSQSHGVLGLKGVTYPGMQVTSIVAENAGLEKSFEDKTVDGFVISEDRRTLSVAFDTGGSVDQLRVLVLADEEEPTN